MNVWVHKFFACIFSVAQLTRRESVISTSADNLWLLLCSVEREGSRVLHSGDSLLALQLPASRQDLGIPVIRYLLNFQSREKT